MTDFWFMLGALAMDHPRALENLNAGGKPAFERICLVLEQITARGAVTWKGLPAAGLLSETDTPAMRRRLRDGLAAPFALAAGSPAPIVSLYTAGKVCQFLNTSEQLLQDTLTAYAVIFADAAAAAGVRPPYSVRLATILGLCMLDDQFCALLSAPALPSGERANVIREFGYDPQSLDKEPEWTAIQQFIQNPTRDITQRRFVRGGSWENGACREKFEFYDNFQGAAN